MMGMLPGTSGLSASHGMSYLVQLSSFEKNVRVVGRVKLICVCCSCVALLLRKYEAPMAQQNSATQPRGPCVIMERSCMNREA